MNTEKYQRTDLADECHTRAVNKKSIIDGVDFSEEQHGPFGLSRLTVKDKSGEALLNKPVGSYVSITFKKLLFMEDEAKDSLALLISRELRRIMTDLCPCPKSVLIAGIGNKSLTCDAIGPFTAESVTVTRPIALEDGELFRRLDRLISSAISPGVSGETGIESADLIKSAVGIVRPDIVIAVDALAARSPDRLLSTVQICSAGITPGSGVKNKKASLDRELLGVPVIALGVPTVVDSSVLIFNALERSGMKEDELPRELTELLTNGENFFVCPKDCDLLVREISEILSHAIDLVLCSP